MYRRVGSSRPRLSTRLRRDSPGLHLARTTYRTATGALSHLLLDASIWLATLDPDDRYHAAARMLVESTGDDATEPQWSQTAWMPASGTLAWCLRPCVLDALRCGPWEKARLTSSRPL